MSQCGAAMTRPAGAHHWEAFVAAALACAGGLFATGCSNYAKPHHPYAPLFERAGQIDVAVSAGPSGRAPVSFAGHAAVAPVDHLQIVAGVDFDPIRESNRTRHVAGELGIGGFVMGEGRLRAELVGGLGGGWASGENEEEDDGPWGVVGPYVRPFVQGVVGGVFDFFTFGGGLRIAATFAHLRTYDTASSDYPYGDGPAEQVHIDPYTTLRFRYELLIVEVAAGASFSFGDSIVGAPIYGYGALTLHFHFDAWAPPTDDEPTPAEDLGSP